MTVCTVGVGGVDATNGCPASQPKSAGIDAIRARALANRSAMIANWVVLGLPPKWWLNAVTVAGAPGAAMPASAAANQSSAVSIAGPASSRGSRPFQLAIAVFGTVTVLLTTSAL